MPALGKKLHHKVARFYLKAWDEQGRDTDEAQIFCLQGGEIRRANVRNLAAENHFYRLRVTGTLSPFESLQLLTLQRF